MRSRNPETGKSGLTLAGILLFGNDQLILSAVPHHRTDLILLKVNLDRYDDRDLIRTNLIESYERIIVFVQKHLPDPFFLEGMERMSLHDAIFRKVAGGQSDRVDHPGKAEKFQTEISIDGYRQTGVD